VRGSTANDGVVLAVRVKPRARRAGLLGRHGDGIKVAVRAAPERGRANDELVEVLMDVLGIRRDQVEIVAGTGSQHKQVRLRELDAADLERRLNERLGEAE